MTIYVASPYSVNADAQLRQERYKYALMKTIEFTKKGLPVFSPIVHSHPMSLVANMPCTFDFWKELDCLYIDNCDQMYVLMMDGWKESIGVQFEIEYAKSKGIPITYVNCVDSPVYNDNSAVAA
jgi:hypothetical protein